MSENGCSLPCGEDNRKGKCQKVAVKERESCVVERVQDTEVCGVHVVQGNSLF